MQQDPTASLIETQEELEDVLSTPTPALCEALSRLDGDIMILGVGGKMGPTLAKLARRAVDLCGSNRRIIGVSRFSSGDLHRDLNEAGVRTIHCDLLDEECTSQLPDVPNIVFMAGRKFGTGENSSLTWAMNAYVPAIVSRHFRHSRIVALSTGNVYPLSAVSSPGPDETSQTGPIGEYAQSCLARERMFQYFSDKHRIPMVLVRLNYAVELRYGVLLDVATKVHRGEAIDLAMGYANVIWQRDANEVILRCLERCTCPPEIINLAGPMISIRQVAERFGTCFGRAPVFTGSEADTALLSNGAKVKELFGPGTVQLDQMVKWVAHWVAAGCQVHDRPTHFEQRQGNF
jgi:nucleoside-diphosphate-sugar epimerase